MWHLKIVQDGIIVTQADYKNVEDAIRTIGLKYYESTGDAWEIDVKLTYMKK